MQKVNRRLVKRNKSVGALEVLLKLKAVLRGAKIGIYQIIIRYKEDLDP